VISIALIEDNRLLREGITALLNQSPDLMVVSGTSSGDMSVLSRVKPEVILLDLGLEAGDSLHVAESVKATFPESRIIVMDLLPVHEDILEFFLAGVAGFITKDATLEDLVSAIRSVANGGQGRLPRDSSSLFSEIARHAVSRGRPAALKAVRMTARERKVIDFIAEGLENTEIARHLHVSTHTVKGLVRNIMEKLALHTRLQIATYSQGSDSSE
jgi:DNA-binding NarL/FixJ family response regulator